MLELKAFYVIRRVSMSKVLKIPAEEMIFISLIATFMGGFLDAYTYVLHGGVFANTQTGNLIFLSIFLAEGEYYEAMLRFIPIIFFIIGIVISEILNKITNKHWRKISLIIQFVLFNLIGFGMFYNKSIIICSTISLICSMQLVSFKKVNGDVFSTIMCTGNLRSFSECISKFILYKKKEELKKGLKYFFIILVFCLGVYLGFFLVRIFNRYSIFLASFIVLVKFIYLHLKMEKD